MILAAMCYGIASLPPNFGESMNCVQISISLTILKRVLPLSLVFVAMITFNNLCLKFVGVSFYYIGNYFEDLKYFLKNIPSNRCIKIFFSPSGRSLTTVFNVIFTYLILGQKTTTRAILCCVTIIFGFWLGIDQENESGSLSISGMKKVLKLCCKKKLF